jgi:hypothetical protein
MSHLWAQTLESYKGVVGQPDVTFPVGSVFERYEKLESEHKQ